MGDLQEPAGPSATKGRGGLSVTGWAAVTALGAAGITAAATLVTHFVPPAGPPQQAVGASSLTGSGAGPTPLPARPATPAPAPVPAPRSTLLEQLTGTWTGPARAGSRPFTLTLVVTSTCAEGEACGTLTSDLLPCVGNIRLVRIGDGPSFEFATGSFGDGSSASCELRPGGDYFVLGDDVLAYRTGYDGSLSGTLRRER
jgi:hypothetical protein